MISGDFRIFQEIDESSDSTPHNLNLYFCAQVQNIDDVLQRGTVLSELDTKTQNLSMLSQKYKKDATYLNRKSMYVKAAAAGFVFLVFVFYFWIL